VAEKESLNADAGIVLCFGIFKLLEPGVILGIDECGQRDRKCSSNGAAAAALLCEFIDFKDDAKYFCVPKAPHCRNKAEEKLRSICGIISSGKHLTKFWIELIHFTPQPLRLPSNYE
jgi:hypothetical protein